VALLGAWLRPARAVTEPIMDAQQCHFWQIGEYSAASDKTTTSGAHSKKSSGPNQYILMQCFIRENMA